MMKRKFSTRKYCLLMLSSLALAGCSQNNSDAVTTSEPIKETKSSQEAEALKYAVDPETFSLVLYEDGKSISAAAAGEKRTYTQYEENGAETSWKYPDENISVTVAPRDNYLSVTITADTAEDQSFTWPGIAADQYYFPFGEGKLVPSDDQIWKDYLNGQEFTVLEQLSMPFWASSHDDFAVLFIMENPFRSNLNFASEPNLAFSVSHDYPAIDDSRENRFRVYLTENDPVSIAKTYKNYVVEKGSFVSLEEKADKNPDIRKLYGAPHVYLWGDFILEAEDVNWAVFRTLTDTSVMDYLLSFAGESETGNEFKTAVEKIKSQDYVDTYQKNTICRYLSEVLAREDFYNPEFLPQSSSGIEQLLTNGYENLNVSDKIKVNKDTLATNLPGAFKAPDSWMDRSTKNLLSQMAEAGIDRAWLGLHSWEQAYQKPELVQLAASQGYLIGSYDSYHSIHAPGKEQWKTARFDDHTLYDQATVENRDGEKIAGFQGVGRKLNPTLSLPSVKERIGQILRNNLPFNSWFIDCDATGEIYDDYSPDHITTQQEDLAARMDRMAYIRDDLNMVIGSEGGNDFAASTVAFAHGIELRTFSWMDKDMKENKESEYYIGKYYNSSGGVAEHFSKRIPIKSNYDTLFVDPRYDVPLFKLVYNNSVITSYHWDWSTFKIQGRTADRMLREILYNVPPLYHLDSVEWEKYQEDLVRHTKVWSDFSRKAILEEMTDFKYLKEDGSVQITEYGKDTRVIANFSDFSYLYESQEIPGHSALIEADGIVSIYTPEISPENS